MQETKLSTNTEQARGHKAIIIRAMYENGMVINQIIDATGFTYNYCHKVIRNHPKWETKHSDKIKLKKLQKLRFNETIALKQGFVKFIDYSKYHVYFFSGSGELFNMTRDDFFEAMI